MNNTDVVDSICVNISLTPSPFARLSWLFWHFNVGDELQSTVHMYVVLWEYLSKLASINRCRAVRWGEEEQGCEMGIRVGL